MTAYIKMDVVDEVLTLASKLLLLQRIQVPHWSHQLLTWLDEGGFEVLRERIAGFLEKLMLPTYEVYVQRLDQPEGKYYTIYASDTVTDLKHSIAEHEQLPVDELLLELVDLPTILFDGRKVDGLAHGPLTDTDTLLVPQGQMLIVYPTDERASWTETPSTHYLEVRTNSAELYEDLGNAVNVNINQTTTVAELRRKIWILTGLPLSEILIEKTLAGILRDYEIIYTRQHDGQMDYSEVQYDMRGFTLHAVNDTVFYIDAWTTGAHLKQDIQSEFTNLVEPFRLFTAPVGDTHRQELTDDDIVLYKVGPIGDHIYIEPPPPLPPPQSPPSPHSPHSP